MNPDFFGNWQWATLVCCSSSSFYLRKLIISFIVNISFGFGPRVRFQSPWKSIWHLQYGVEVWMALQTWDLFKDTFNHLFTYFFLRQKVLTKIITSCLVLPGICVFLFKSRAFIVLVTLRRYNNEKFTWIDDDEIKSDSLWFNQV